MTFHLHCHLMNGLCILLQLLLILLSFYGIVLSFIAVVVNMYCFRWRPPTTAYCAILANIQSILIGNPVRERVQAITR